MKQPRHIRLIERLTDSLAGPARVAALLGVGCLCAASLSTGNAATVAAAPVTMPIAHFANVAGHNSNAPSHYDSDGDGLIEVATPEQLNAIRYDLDGDGAVEDDEETEGVDEAAAYRAAFPVAAEGSVCPDGTSCTGYELTADLDLDTDGDGEADDDDTYWNDGAGWQPIGKPDTGFTATFEGNGRSISNLFIDQGAENHMGLFGLVGENAEIRNVGLVGLSVTGSQYVGGLAGQVDESTVSGLSGSGSVAGKRHVGGLVGYGQNSVIADSRSSAGVTAMGDSGSGRAGGLVGELQGTGSEGGVKSAVLRSYATGTVSSNLSRVGGLVGNLYGGNTVPALVSASYATGAVSGSSNVGGLVGRNQRGTVTASYATGAVSGDGNTGGLVGNNRGTVTNSYFDTDTSGQTDATQGKTTAELQAPTGYDTPEDNIFAQWNVDLDGDDAADDPWDFGDASQYPALKADGPDEDATATWQEFGGQLRSRLVVSVSADVTEVTLSWTAPASTDYAGAPTVTYRVYRDGSPIGAAQAALTYTDAGLTEGFTHVYRVDVLLNGEPVRSSNAAAAPPPVSISIDDAQGAEGGDVTFTITKTGSGAVSLTWTASIGDSDTAETADLGATTSGMLTFATADTGKSFTVATVQDAMDENDETFTVTLAATSGMPNMADGTATGTITDDDRVAGAPTGLAASTGSGKGEIDLAWTEPSDAGVLNGTDPASITGYRYRRAESSAGLDSASWSAAGTATTFTVTGLTGGTTHHFQVQALNGVTPGSAASNEASAATIALSSDADLSGLAISQGTLSPEFDAAKAAYTAAVANSVESLTVTPTAAESNATIKVNDSAVTSGSASEAIALTAGENVVKVVVTAEDGTEKTYTITVTRAGPEISVDDAAGTEGGSVSFAVSKTGAGAVTLSWTASIEETDTAVTADLGATTSGTVTFATDDTSKAVTVATAQDALDESNETFTVTLSVTSGPASVSDGTATGTINDDDESAGAPTGLTASTGSGEGEVDLAWTAPSDTGVLNGADPADVTGYQYRSAESSAGLESAAWTDAGAATAFTVTGLTGGTTYYFQVRAINGVTPESAASNEDSAAAKALSSNADLSTLEISHGALSPEFTAGETAYTATVDNGVDSLTVTPTAADGNAAIAVNDIAVNSDSAGVAVALDVGPNAIAVAVTAEDGTVKRYMITVTRTGPSLSVDDAEGGEGDAVTFTVTKTGVGPVSLNWTASIGESDTAGIADLGATTSGTVDFAASDAGKSFTVETAQDSLDEIDETFTVTLTVASGPASLSDPTAAGVITDDDESAGAPTGLIASTGSGAGEVALSWTAPSDTGVLNGASPAAITGYQYRRAESSAGLDSASWTAAGTATTFTASGLNGGATYYFQVRALNGVTPEGAPSNEDSATAKAASSNAKLSRLEISPRTRLPGFAPENTEYTVPVANRVTTITVTPTAADSKATIAVNGSPVASGSPSGAIALRVGANVIRIVVTAEDGTTKTYTVTVRRAAPPTTSPLRRDAPSSPTVDAPDPAASVAINDANAMEGDDLTFTVNKEGAGAVTVEWRVSLEEPDTASREDLGARLSGTVALAVSDTSKSFTVATVQDTFDESEETFFVILAVSSGAATVTDGKATGAIIDDDRAAGVPTGLTASTGGGKGEIDLAWSEPLDTGMLNGAEPAAITAYQYRRSESAAGLSSAAWTSVGTQTDFTVAGLVGGTTHYFQVRALNGVVPKGAASDEASATAKALPVISIDDARGIEGSGVSFTVSKTGAGAATLDWTASFGESDTAEAADLGATTSGTVAFADWDTSKTFTVATVQDAMDEGDETFTVTLTAAPGAASLADGTATGTIADDDEQASAPTGLTATPGDGEGEIDLAWSPPPDGGVLNGAEQASVAGYQYRLAESSEELPFAPWKTIEGTATNITVSGLKDGTAYYFQVRSVNGVTSEGAAAAATGTPIKRAIDPPVDTPAPTRTPAHSDGSDDNADSPAAVDNPDDAPQQTRGAKVEPEPAESQIPPPTPSATATPAPTSTVTPAATPQPTIAPTAALMPTPDRRAEAAPTSTPAPTATSAAEPAATAVLAPTAAPSPPVVAPDPMPAADDMDDGNLPVWAWLAIGTAALAIVAAGAYVIGGRGGRIKG